MSLKGSCVRINFGEVHIVRHVTAYWSFVFLDLQIELCKKSQNRTQCELGVVVAMAAPVAAPMEDTLVRIPL